MNFELDEQQRMLREAARSFLEAECGRAVLRQLEASDSGHSPDLWRKMAGLGWMGIIVPEPLGGVGMSLLELAVLFEEIGRAAFDSPLLGTIMGTLAILEGGTEAQKQALLPRVISGELILTVALAESQAVNDLRFIAAPAERAGSDYVLRGRKLFVPYASVADEILVAARTAAAAGDESGLTLFIVGARAPGVHHSLLRTIAPDKQFRLDLDEVRVPRERIVGEVDEGLAVLRPVLEKATAIQCAEMVGGAERELEITAAYTRERVQFDRPIGTFQAVQHRLADMLTDVEGSRWTSYQAIYRLSRGAPAARELAIAKAFTSDACQRVAFGAQQLHGGAGVDLANDLHFYYRRAKALELRFGPAPVHLEALARDPGGADGTVRSPTAPRRP